MPAASATLLRIAILRRVTVCLCLICVALAVQPGCQPTNPVAKTTPDATATPKDGAPTSASPPSPSRSPSRSQADDSAAQDAASIDDQQTPEPATSPDTPRETSAGDTSEAADTPSANADAADMPDVPSDRIMLLTQTGPLLIDLHITINGKPHQQSLDSVIDGVMAIADEDGDGIVSWERLMTHPRFREGQFGNPATSTYQAQQDMIRLYDTTQNGRVDRDELIRYLTSNQATPKSLALVTSNYRRITNRDDSAIRRWLDVNDDLILDAEEIAAAPRRLRLRDTNDDEVLRPEDFADPMDMQNGLGNRRRPRDSEFLPKVGWLIRGGQPWSDMRVAWNHYYARGRDVTKDDLQVGMEVFDAIDLDQDDSLDNIEMEMLSDTTPQIELDVELVTGEDEASAVINVKALRLPSEQILSMVQHQPNRITIELPETSLDFFVRDTIGYARYDEQATMYLQQGDQDNNEYLDADEFAAVGQFLNSSFAVIDLDGNEKVFADEITTALKQRNIVQRNQVTVRADDQDDALLPSIDLNSDGRIDSREIARCSESLLELDRNDDGSIDLQELRGTMMVGVVRGGGRGQIGQGDTTFQVPAVQRKPSAAQPRWFTGMDRNQDGGISWKEFLGTRQQFDELDRDTDGFIVVDEIADVTE